MSSYERTVWFVVLLCTRSTKTTSNEYLRGGDTRLRSRTVFTERQFVTSVRRLGI